MNEPEQKELRPAQEFGFRPLDSGGAFCDPASVHVDENGHCTTCSDEALPARVLEVSEDLWTARVDMDGQEIEVDISLVDKAVPGTWLLVHGGVALGLIAEAEAQS